MEGGPVEVSDPAEGTPGGLALSDTAGGAAGEMEQVGMEPTPPPRPQAAPRPWLSCGSSPGLTPPSISGVTSGPPVLDPLEEVKGASEQSHGGLGVWSR